MDNIDKSNIKNPWWEPSGPPLDKGKNQWVKTTGRARERVVYGECNLCGTDEYGDSTENFDLDVFQRLYNSKFGVPFGQNICFRCWVHSEDISGAMA